MRYQREAPFRFQFNESEPATFQIVRIDNKSVQSSRGEAKIVDISIKGLRLNSELNIPETDNKAIQLALTFKLNEVEFTCNGDIMWKKMTGSSFDYGIQFVGDDFAQRNLIEQLKIYARKISDDN
ncbi:hypothetical protein CIL05_18565 [Virgibacillus profundi]|uniref:PilZ domain-containing protein n=1 Tax=Virgibacillus profundi TaxID=2024555 RepID=A0A2A2I7Y5_9BACI|nr:PilZ domain-containing protein [Virgibacillus profundi]PAV28111.1 hypothetical protein CIL05_18565 [Virgibacillus profundi]PXY52416.1 PilZ domain-containing protein [Virgibacillus profundi]